VVYDVVVEQQRFIKALLQGLCLLAFSLKRGQTSNHWSLSAQHLGISGLRNTVHQLDEKNQQRNNKQTRQLRKEWLTAVCAIFDSNSPHFPQGSSAYSGQHKLSTVNQVLW